MRRLVAGSEGRRIGRPPPPTHTQHLFLLFSFSFLQSTLFFSFPFTSLHCLIFQWSTPCYAHIAGEVPSLPNWVRERRGWMVEVVMETGSLLVPIRHHLLLHSAERSGSMNIWASWTRTVKWQNWQKWLWTCTTTSDENAERSLKMETREGRERRDGEKKGEAAEGDWQISILSGAESV